MGRRRLARTLVAVITISALSPACSSGDGDSTASSASPAVETPVGGTTPAERLASHLFLAAGDERGIEGCGELLEVIEFGDEPALSVTGDTIRGERGGTACLRFRYRPEGSENSVQTLCVVVFDEVGPCEGRPPLSLDLLAFLPSERDAGGNANLLESGAGRFYRACLGDGGRYRLQPTKSDLPPLYFHIVDALGDGPYSLGTDEVERQRNGAVTTFGGEEIRPPWILTVSREVSELSLTSESFQFNQENCSDVPSCTPDANTVRRGDILRVGWGIEPGLFEEVVGTAPSEVLDAYVRGRMGVSWEDLSSVHPDLKWWAMWRLINLDVLEEAIWSADTVHHLREKEVPVALFSFWAAREVSEACYPDPAEKARCREFERALGEEEARRIGALKESGFSVWLGVPLDYTVDGEPVSVAAVLRPPVSLFDGVLAGVNANPALLPSEMAEAMSRSVAALAADVGPEMPVILVESGPPIRAATGGDPCEADICPSDFRGAYEQTEAWLAAALEAFSPARLRGFGAALFEGAHFDIRDPHEQFEGFALNRAGETGYNNPVLNIWRAK